MTATLTALLCCITGIDVTNCYDAATPPPKAKVESAFIFTPGADWTYAHHPSVTYFQGRFLAMWSNGRVDEDAPGQRVLVSSSDDFLHWAEAKPLLGPLAGEHAELVLTAAGFHVHGGTIVAYVGKYEYAPEHLDGDARKEGDAAHQNTGLLALTSTDGVTWSAPRDLGLPVVPNQPPVALRSGRLLLCGNVAFPYTDDPAGLAGWTLAGIFPPGMGATLFDDSEGFRLVQREASWPVGLCEGSFYQTGDGTAHTLLRSGTDRLWLTESADDGATWSAPRRTEFTDNVSKFHCGCLPDGRFYCIGNPDPEPRGRRCPLVLSLSEDGARFCTHYVLADEPREMRTPGLYKGGVYAYPHSLVRDGYLCVIVSVCKESVLALRAELAQF